MPLSGIKIIRIKIGTNCRKKWHSRFAKRNAILTQIGGYTDTQDIVNCFKQTFCLNAVLIHTLTLKGVTEFFKKMSYVDDDVNLHNNAFDVLDIEKAPERLKLVRLQVLMVLLRNI